MTVAPKQLQNLKSVGGRSLKKRVGRGGKRGKTAGRGTKGQNARAGHRKRPEIRDMIKKLPKRRGYGKNRSRTVNSAKVIAFPLSLTRIATMFKAGDTVSPQALVEKGVVVQVGRNLPRIKILGNDGLSHAVSVTGCEVSTGAKKAIEAAGGKVA
ncbi:MAG: uL15 family ribosomal protein [Minisyncoccia bacterium]